jgi:hypothetical protein
MSDDPLYDQLRLHFALDGPAGDTQSQREDVGVPSRDDADALRAFQRTAQPCETSAGGGDAETKGAIGQANELNQENLAVLIARQESWGEFVTTRDTIDYEQKLILGGWFGELRAGQAISLEPWQQYVAATQSQLASRLARVADVRVCRTGYRINCVNGGSFGGMSW